LIDDDEVLPDLMKGKYNIIYNNNNNNNNNNTGCDVIWYWN